MDWSLPEPFFNGRLGGGWRRRGLSMASFDLRITRRLHWMEPCDNDIAESEWRALVDADPELEWLAVAEGRTHRGATIRFASPLLAVWIANPEVEPLWFDFCEGSVIISDPDHTAIDKIRSVAARLTATVQDNDGKAYDT